MKKVLVGGCFDLLHYGHVRFLEEAKKLGSIERSNWILTGALTFYESPVFFKNVFFEKNYSFFFSSVVVPGSSTSSLISQPETRGWRPLPTGPVGWPTRCGKSGRGFRPCH